MMVHGGMKHFIEALDKGTGSLKVELFLEFVYLNRGVRGIFEGIEQIAESCNRNSSIMGFFGQCFIIFKRNIVHLFRLRLQGALKLHRIANSQLWLLTLHK